MAGATLFSYVGDRPPSNLRKWSYEGSTTHRKGSLNLDPGISPGSQVWLTAFWYNRKAQTGPRCPAASLYVQFGMYSQAA